MAIGDVPVVKIETENRSKALSPDAQKTFDAIHSIAPCTRREAREAAYAAYGQRSSVAKRQAFKNSLDALVSLRRLVVSGTEDSDTISVREREDNVSKREETHVPHVSGEREVVPPFKGEPHALTVDAWPEMPEHLRRAK
jgi:hypothetical protein